MASFRMDFGFNGIDDLPRVLRNAAVVGGQIALQITDAKTALALARRIEEAAPRGGDEARLLIIERRPPMSHLEAVMYAFVGAQAFMVVVVPFAAGLLGLTR